MVRGWGSAPTFDLRPWAGPSFPWAHREGRAVGGRSCASVSPAPLKSAFEVAAWLSGDPGPRASFSHRAALRFQAAGQCPN